VTEGGFKSRLCFCQERVPKHCLFTESFKKPINTKINKITYFIVEWHVWNPYLLPFTIKQRWASTLANRSNARHRSNIRAPSPRPPPQMYVSKVWESVWPEGAGSDSWLAGVRMSHICPCTPCPPPPPGRKGQR
jgi:hypothetical protein